MTGSRSVEQTGVGAAGQTAAVDAGRTAFPVSSPSIVLPKGGGAIKGIGEKFAANPATGTGSMSVPIAVSQGRAGFGPQLSLSYDSGAGNGPFGVGWSLALPSITRKTDKGLPQYFDHLESDVFILSGAEDLVPVRNADGSRFRDEESAPGFVIDRFRPRVEGLFASIERWSRAGSPADVHWRSISKDNILTLYGHDANSRVADPLDPVRIFSWLICESRDDKGNGIRYLYKSEDGDYQPRPGQADPFIQAHQHNRGDASDARRTAQRYLQRVLYGNVRPLLDAQGRRPRNLSDLPVGPTDTRADWLFEVRLDYGELDETDPTGQPEKPWFYRPDAFSSYRSRFEVRTCRRCERVLMLHHIPDQPAGSGRSAQSGYRGVVRSVELTYDDEIDPGLASSPVYSYLAQIVQTGWNDHDGASTRRSLPPVEFGYSRPVVQDAVESVDPDDLANVPIGLDGATYRWTDLHGEGLPGILTEQAGSWFYKRNRSPIPTVLPDGGEVVKARFAALETVGLRPNVALAAGADLMDLAGDGQLDLVLLDGPMPGLFEHDLEEGWETFRPFTSRLDRDMGEPNLRWIDLDGDGHTDVLITEDEAFVWHPSLAEDGFGPAQRVFQPLGEDNSPRIVFADSAQSMYLADCTGDGLTDIVRIRNGEVCYWPNLGYARFGGKVTMDNSPWFDNPDQFDHRRIRLADIDGSGSADIMYLHRDGVRLYFNQSGNGWSQPHDLTVVPRIDDLESIVPIDLLGNGTACLVWSSALPGDARRSMHYVNLMGADKPHLLIRTMNNLGAETHLRYAPSTKFYLQDKVRDTPWLTRLPFPVHVVERVDTYDHVSRSHFVTRYAYHHGYFDGTDREFRGFGMVEQWDTEQFAALNPEADNIAAESHVPPVHTKTWFHTGAYLGRDRISRHFEHEYFVEPGLTVETTRSLLLDETIVPSGLSPEEEREACRAMKGSMLRQEVYADDAEHVGATLEQARRARTPYTVTEQNFNVRTLQPHWDNRHAVFFVHARETLSLHYERDPTDPRVEHALTLEVDDFGNILKQVAVGYGRRAEVHVVDEQGNIQLVSNPGLPTDSADQLKQTTALLTYTEHRMTNAVESLGTRRNPLLCEAMTYELTGYTPTASTGRFQAADFVEQDPDNTGRLRHKFTAPDVLYEASAIGDQRRRPIECQRVLYRSDELDGILPLGDLQPLALPGESYKLAFTPGLLDHVYQRPHTGQTDRLLPNPAEVLAGQAGHLGGYLQSQTLSGDGRFPLTDAPDHWWVSSGLVYFSTNLADDAATELAHARQHFFTPCGHRDPFGQDAFVDFDLFDLKIVETRDALDNRVSVDANDYRVLQPRLVSDPNRNRTEVAFDALGMVVGTAVMGKPAPAPVEGDSLVGFTPDLTEAQLDGFFDAGQPHAMAESLLKNATTRVVYDLDRFRRTQRANHDDPTTWQPARTATLSRETHANTPLPPQGLKIQLSFSCSDGFGHEIQKKLQAERGPLDVDDPHAAIVDPRWVGSGWTIYNNKGKPVRQYKQFFSSTHHFEFGVKVGVSPVLFYDPAGRVIATLHPNNSYEKVVFSPWQQTTYDVNDTCAQHPIQPGDPSPPQIGDPRIDPDIRGYVNAYFTSQPATWQSWHARRIGNAMGTDERNAAERAAAHANTPATAHLDALGRPFLTVARNRVVCAGHDLDGTEESVETRVELDIEGNQRVLRDAVQQSGDPRGRVVMQYSYDLLGNRIHQLSMEAGGRWTLNDAAGKPIRAWDSRGHNFATRYDELRRPIEHTVRGTFSETDPTKPKSDPRTLNRTIVVDKIEYGEPPRNAAASEEAHVQRLNLRTRIVRHADSAGIATNARVDASDTPTEAYDFKGNLLHSTRRLVTDYTAIPHWGLNPQLDAEVFEGSTRYDALNRPIQSIAPHSSLTRVGRTSTLNVVQPVFNEANLLERVDVWLERTAEPTGLLNPIVDAPSPIGVVDIDYDAQGQRTLIDYTTREATVVRTTFTYDPETFRLTHLYTRRGVDPTTTQGVAFTDDCENPDPPPTTIASPEHPPPGKGCGLQNLHFTYDAAGNITHIRDAAQQTVYFRNKRVEPSNDYVYDALYRLIQTSGREHLGQVPGGERLPPTVPDGFNAFHTRLDHPGEGNAMGTYTERYVYDAVGNFLQMQHLGRDPAHPGWTRAYTHADVSLTEPSKHSNRLTSTQVGNGAAAVPETYLHDAHGNMLRMPHLGGGGAGPNMDWDYKDRLQHVHRGGGGDAFSVYDGSGQRVRKVWEKSLGLTEERIYLGGFEIFRKHPGTIGSNTAVLERETLHVMDDKQRIALVETRTLDAAGDDKAPRKLIRYQLGNHLGSACLELDEGAEIISYEEYAPYGSSTYQAVRSQTETAKRYRYTGKERDEETGLYYHGARYYAPWIGRWLACDPVTPGDGPNSYVYSRCSPIILVDPTGSAGQLAPQLELIQQTELRQPVTATATTPGFGQRLRTTYQNLSDQWMLGEVDVGHPEGKPFAMTRAGETTSVYVQPRGENRSAGSTADKARVAEARANGEFARRDGVDTTVTKGTRYGQPDLVEKLKDVKAAAPRNPQQLELDLQPRLKPSAVPEQLDLFAASPAKVMPELRVPTTGSATGRVAAEASESSTAFVPKALSASAEASSTQGLLSELASGAKSLLKRAGALVLEAGVKIATTEIAVMIALPNDLGASERDKGLARDLFGGVPAGADIAIASVSRVVFESTERPVINEFYTQYPTPSDFAQKVYGCGF